MRGAALGVLFGGGVALVAAGWALNGQKSEMGMTLLGIGMILAGTSAAWAVGFWAGRGGSISRKC